MTLSQLERWLAETQALRARVKPFPDWALGCLLVTGRLPTAEEIDMRRAIIQALEDNIRTCEEALAARRHWKRV